MRVVALDQVDLPLPVPAFQLLFALDCELHLTEELIPHEVVDIVFRSKTGKRIVAMLPQAWDEVGCYSDV